MVGDLPVADAAPPSNMIFVCKLNPVTTEEVCSVLAKGVPPSICCMVVLQRQFVYKSVPLMDDNQDMNCLSIPCDALQYSCSRTSRQSDLQAFPVYPVVDCCLAEVQGIACVFCILTVVS